MADSDAEWVGVDFEFGQAGPTTTTRRPARPRQPRPTFTEKPVAAPRPDAPEVEGPPTDLVNSGSVTVISSVIGGLLGVVLILLVVYMVVLRRRLNKAKVASTDSQYQLRVEDVAHLTHLDETTNTYVNTTDLQKLLTSVKAKGMAQEKPPPTMPKIVHQTPTPYRAAAVNKSHTTQVSSENNGYTSDSDVVVLRAPMPLPHDPSLYDDAYTLENNWTPNPSPETEVLYSNLEQTEPFKLSKPPPRRKLEAPAAAPPPPPTKQKDVSAGGPSLEKSEPTSPTVIARPAPPPPKLVKTKSSETLDLPNSKIPLLPGNSKPIPPVAPKPNKSGELAVTNSESSDSKLVAVPLKNPKPIPPPASKPTPPVLSKPTLPATSKPVPPAAKPGPPTALKPGVTTKAKGLPPLKMALIPSLNRSSVDSCTTPDTGMIELTPENTPTPDTGSISSKIAFLEGKMKTPILPIRAKP